MDSAVNWEGHIEGAYFMVIRAFVLLGFATTKTLIDRLATFSKASPVSLKILALARRRSVRSMPGRWGIEAIRIAMSASANASSGDVVITQSEQKSQLKSIKVGKWNRFHY